MPREGKGGEDD
jgi:hypothetical protein